MKKRHKNKIPKIHFIEDKGLEKRQLIEEKLKLEELSDQLKNKEKYLRANSEIIDNTIHEIRKINNQIKSSTLSLSEELGKLEILDEQSDTIITSTLKTLDANTQLLSLRMDAYDMVINPSSVNNEIEHSVKIYSSVEKVYKCLYSAKKDKKLQINLCGQSDKSFRLKNSILLAYFIIIENAIKYSYTGGAIDIIFNEISSGLEVLFKNPSLCPSEDELERLTERGYRSPVTADLKIKGSGLGLYILKEICEQNNVQYSFSIEPPYTIIDGKEYKTFVVKLLFERQKK